MFISIIDHIQSLFVQTLTACQWYSLWAKLSGAVNKKKIEIALE